MSSKRMTSVSVADLHASVSNLSINGIDVSSKIPKTFETKYIKMGEIGRGGFSYVYKCKDRITDALFAVKIIDLRPLRLRDNFDPNRLRREVDIMRNLRHPNIVQFVEYFETPDEFYMVLEYCPGRELFDVILEKQSLPEATARPIFHQITSAVSYLHSLNIMHRDIKPENILVLDDPDPNTGLPRVKLLDFGLSKEAGHNGSAGKSFVGTPCYLAPEVEYTSHGQGGVYGLAADCWSLGALLHVMLVARFPEFERDRKGIVSLVLPSKYWREISVQARDLVKSLMEPNSFARLTIKEVMEHPWQGIYRTAHTRDASIAHGAPPPPPSVASTPEVSSRSALGLPRENAINSLVVKAAPRGTISDPPENADGALTLGPLLNLQRSIALCFEDALSSYADYPEVATQIYKGAVMCRKQLMDSTKMLRKVEQTASSVLELFPDLELAVEEGAPQLAADFFSVVRSWVIELRDTVTTTQLANHESMLQIHAIIHESTVGLNRREASSSANLADSLKSHLDQSAVLSNIKRMQGLLDKSGGGSLTSDQIFELFMSLFNSAVDQTLERRETDETTEQGDREGDREGDAIDVGVASSSRAGSALSAEDSVEEMPHPTQSHTYVPEDSDPLESNLFNQVAVVGSDGTRSAASAKLVEALYKLRQVDLILEQLSVFWANTEVVLDVLAKKGQHAEQFIAFANKPRLLSRFKERLAEYSQFWIGVRDMCSKYVSNVQPQAETKIRLYEFLEKESSKDSSSMSEQLYGSTLMNRNASTVSSAYATPDRGVGINSSERFDKVDSI